MASERIQRQIDRLLDEAEEAISRFDWESLHQAAQAVLRFDPENIDARRGRRSFVQAGQS